MLDQSISPRDVPLFDGIKEEELSDLLLCMKARNRRYHKGEYILLDQDEVQEVGVVLSGMVHMLKEDSQGHNTLITYLEKGDVLGESFAVKEEKNSYVSFFAATDAHILFLSLSQILHPCKKNCPFHGRVAKNLLQLIGEKNLRLMERIEVSSKTTLREKIMAYLMLLEAKQGQKYIEVPLNRSEMASFLHSNRSAMSRELMAMKADGLIDYDGNTFVLKK